MTKLYVWCFSFLFLFACKQKDLKVIDEKLLIEKIMNQELNSLEGLIVKDTLGTIITAEDFIKLRTGQRYVETVYVNDKNEVVEVHLT